MSEFTHGWKRKRREGKGEHFYAKAIRGKEYRLHCERCAATLKPLHWFVCIGDQTLRGHVPKLKWAMLRAHGHAECNR